MVKFHVVPVIMDECFPFPSPEYEEINDTDPLRHTDPSRLIEEYEQRLAEEERRIEEEAGDRSETEVDPEEAEEWMDGIESPLQKTCRGWTAEYQARREVKKAARQARRRLKRPLLSPPATPPHMELSGPRPSLGRPSVGRIQKARSRSPRSRSTRPRMYLGRRSAVTRSRSNIEAHVSLHHRKGMVLCWPNPSVPAPVTMTNEEYYYTFVSRPVLSILSLSLTYTSILKYIDPLVIVLRILPSRKLQQRPFTRVGQVIYAVGKIPV